MLLNAGSCPICGQSVQPDALQCSACGCLIQFTPDPPAFARAQVNEELVQPVLERSRAQVGQNTLDGVAAYTLGLCYLNYELFDQGIEQVRRATALLPEKHIILFELATLLNRPGQYAVALEYAAQAVRLAPDLPTYRYLHHYLSGATAYARGELANAVSSWIAAYQEAPQWQPAAATLRQFIASNEAKLTQPIARTLPGLSPQEVEQIRVLNSNPALRQPDLPRAPRPPGQLGTVSMGLLRRVSPTRATAIEQMHAERIAAFQQATIAYQEHHRVAVERNAAMIAEWQAQDRAIRNDMGGMARLCLAVVQEEERLRLEQERRQAEAEQRRQAQQQKVAQARAATQAVLAGQKKVREKQYLSTRAQYISGLPKGKEKDEVALVVTNLQIVIKHSGMLGAWEHTIPMTALAEVSGVVVKHFMLSEKRLQITYRDERGMPAHALFAGLKVDDCVHAVLRARSGK